MYFDLSLQYYRCGRIAEKVEYNFIIYTQLSIILYNVRRVVDTSDGRVHVDVDLWIDEWGEDPKVLYGAL